MLVLWTQDRVEEGGIRSLEWKEAMRGLILGRD